MWLLAAMVFVVAPHLLRLPYWVGVFFLAVVAWRAWIAWAAMHFPDALGHAGAHARRERGDLHQYGRIFGREAGVTLLILMAALKLLEMRTQREVLLSIYLGFFLVLTNFLFSQSIPLGIYMLVCVWIFIATLVGFNRVGSAPSLGERLRPAGALLVQALPLMVAFFILFPRAQGPLWALPQDTRAGDHGLSESMTPGQHREPHQVRRARLPRAVRGRAPALLDALLARPGAGRLRRHDLERAADRAAGKRQLLQARAPHALHGHARAAQQDVALRPRRARRAAAGRLCSATCRCATAAR